MGCSIVFVRHASLSSTFLKNHTLGSFCASPQTIVQEAMSRIDQNVALRRFAAHLIQCMAGEDASPSSPTATKEEIEGMVAKFSVGLRGPMVGEGAIAP